MTAEQRYRAVIFDLDGTLLDTLDDLCESMNRVLERHGLPLHPAGSYRQFVGNGAAKLIERSLPENLRTSGYIQQYLQEFLEDYSRNWAVNTAPYPGICSMLNELAGRGARMAILSNKIHDFTTRCVSRYLADFNFEVVIGERPGARRKPAPDGALEIAERLGILPENTVYVGDTSIDMKTGTGAGMFTVGVLWGFRQRSELEESGAMKIIDAPEQLLELF